MIKLSICIPTYNRANMLKEALNSIIISAKGFEESIEIIILDNASSDNTKDVAQEFLSGYGFIKYLCHEKTIGGNLNIYEAAKKGTAEYIWIFSDDDKIIPETIKTVLGLIDSGYNLIKYNSSVWTQDFSSCLKASYLPYKKDSVFKSHNELMKKFSLHLGFISSVVFKRDVYFSISSEEYIKFIEYGFPHLYAIYSGLINNCTAYFVSKPLIEQRGLNSEYKTLQWYKYFAEGSTLIFNELNKKGYTITSIINAKNLVLKDYIMHDISFRRRQNMDISGVFKILYDNFKGFLFFWVVCVPELVAPRFLVWIANKIVVVARKFRSCLIRSNNKMIRKISE